MHSWLWSCYSLFSIADIECSAGMQMSDSPGNTWTHPDSVVGDLKSDKQNLSSVILYDDVVAQVEMWNQIWLWDELFKFCENISKNGSVGLPAALRQEEEEAGGRGERRGSGGARWCCQWKEEQQQQQQRTELLSIIPCAWKKKRKWDRNQTCATRTQPLCSFY